MHAHTYAARAGHHLAPQPLSSGKNVFEELGDGFTLIDLTEGTAGAAFERAAAGLGIPLKVIRDTASDGRETYEARLILVRPDQFVAYAGNNDGADASEILMRVVGQS